jgi:hypothetical protein
VALEHALAPADVDDDVAVFLALDDAVDDGALAVLELLVLAVAFGPWSRMRCSRTTTRN